MSRSLDPLFRPRAVAVLGASRQHDSIGGRILHNLVSNGFNGPVFPVNPKAPFVGSLKAYPSVLDVPDPVDLAVVVVPKGLVVPVLDECGRKGIRGAVVITAGFRELGGKGVELEAELKATSARHGIRLIGPNCMGIINTEPEVSLNASFAKAAPRPGRIAFLSQSGALGEAVLDRARQLGVGLHMFASIGNKADVSTNDLLEYWGEDPDIDLILLYLENFGNPRNFCRIARDVTHQKPVIAVKSGRTAAGQRAASSHTGSLAGSDLATEALLAQCGVLRALTVEQLFDFARAFSHTRLPKGRRVVVISNAGGPAILAADACVQWGLEVPHLSDETQARIRPGVNPDASLQNPIDLVAQAGPDNYRATVGPAFADPAIDAAIVLCVPPAYIDTNAVARAIVAPPRDIPVLSCFMGIAAEGQDILEAAGIPVFAFPESAARSLAALARYRELRDRPAGQVPAVAADRDRARALVDRARAQGRLELGVPETLELLACYGVPTAPTRLARRRDEAIDAGRAIGYPVVLKSGTAGHKTERGAVAVDLRSTDDLIAAWERIFHGADDLLPAVVQPMCRGGKEVALGITTDRDLGQLVMFGLGGIFVELLRDVTFRLLPLTDVDAGEMVRSIRGLPLLTGFRGDEPVDLAAIERALHGVAALAYDLPAVVELDVNPFLVFPPGREPVAVDARVRLLAP
jgi:acetyltransferase